MELRKGVLLGTLALLLSAAAHPAKADIHQTGIASYYSQGPRTASGERYNPTAMTAAHRSLPFNTMVRVTNLSNGKWVVVRINDRGPFVRGRIIDVSPAAATELDFTRRGITKVQVSVMRDKDPEAATSASGKARGGARTALAD